MENYNENNGFNEAVSMPEEQINPVIVKKKVKGGYNWASGLILLIQALVVAAIIIFGIVFSAAVTPKIMAENPGIEMQELQTKVTEAASTNDISIISNAACMILAEIVTIIIAFGAAKRFKFKETLGSSKLPASGIALGALTIIGVQGISIMIQNLVISLTGYTGVNEEFANQLSFSDNLVPNIVLILYAVIIGPILEEILYRGLALNLLAPVNRTFALIVSSLLFGLMHCNFNQIFNGFLLGLVLGYVALKSGSIIASCVCHIFANANAFLLSYIFEETLAPQIGDETAATYYMITFAVEMIIGIIAAVFMLKKYGKIKSDDMIVTSYGYEIAPSETKKYTVSMLLKSPTFWLSAIYCLYSAVTLVTAIS